MEQSVLIQTHMLIEEEQEAGELWGPDRDKTYLSFVAKFEHVNLNDYVSGH